MSDFRTNTLTADEAAAEAYVQRVGRHLTDTEREHARQGYLEARADSAAERRRAAQSEEHTRSLQ